MILNIFGNLNEDDVAFVTEDSTKDYLLGMVDRN